MSYIEVKTFKYSPEERAAMRLSQKAYRDRKKIRTNRDPIPITVTSEQLKSTFQFFYYLSEKLIQKQQLTEEDKIKYHSIMDQLRNNGLVISSSNKVS